MTDIEAMAAWLRQQFDEDERRATGAAEQTGEHWTAYFKQVTCESSRFGEDAADANSSEVAEHIAEHDPARVLRRIAAYRKILDEWADNHEAADADACPNEWNGGIDMLGNFVLPQLAAEYAERPGYRDEWKS